MRAFAATPNVGAHGLEKEKIESVYWYPSCPILSMFLLLAQVARKSRQDQEL